MSLPSEYEPRRKLNKIKEDVNKRVRDVRDQFAKIEKVKLDALKKTEELKRSAEKEIAKLEEGIAKSGLTSDTKKTLASDIFTLKKEIEDRTTELRSRISKTIIPS